MHPFDIICALRHKGYTQRRLARELGITIQTVNAALHGHESNYNVATAISAATSIPLSRLWPDGRYNRPPRQARARRAA